MFENFWKKRKQAASKKSLAGELSSQKTLVKKLRREIGDMQSNREISTVACQQEKRELELRIADLEEQIESLLSRERVREMEIESLISVIERDRERVQAEARIARMSHEEPDRLDG